MLKLGLIGYPISHSLSPWIHERLLKQQRIQGTYKRLEFKEDEFDTKIRELKQSEIDGFNITVPYKEKILPYLDKMDGSAEVLGAVNTVKVTREGWVGYNTDGTGYTVSLKRRYPDSLNPSARVLVIGSGGAARGIYYALLQENVSRVDITNRTMKRAGSIIEMNDGLVDSAVLSLNEAEKKLDQYDVIIQTTTVGMSPNDQESILSPERVRKGTIVSDIVYRPKETEFLTQASHQGAKLHYGHEMLLQQAVYAFQIWTNTEPETKQLLDEFEYKLKGV